MPAKHPHVDRVFSTQIGTGFRYATASRPLQVVAAVLTVTGVVGNGGFAYLFEMPIGEAGDDPDYRSSLRAFQEIGAERAHAAYAEALARFQAGEFQNDAWRDPPRIELLERAFWNADDETMDCLEAYALRHIPLADE